MMQLVTLLVTTMHAAAAAPPATTLDVDFGAFLSTADHLWDWPHPRAVGSEHRPAALRCWRSSRSVLHRRTATSGPFPATSNTGAVRRRDTVDLLTARRHDRERPALHDAGAPTDCGSLSSRVPGCFCSTATPAAAAARQI